MCNSMRKGASPIGRHEVPEQLVNQSQKAVRSWAREILRGEEPDLTNETIRRIQKGELRKVFLRPKKKGFFTDEGIFIEAFDYEPGFGDDLSEADKKWEAEEKERQWIDWEDQTFNQRTNELAEKPVLAMWEHGKRIIQYVEETGRAVYSLQEMLAKRGGEAGYSLYAHQVFTDLYLWKKDARPDDSVFSLTWGHIDCIIKFAREKTVRDNALNTMSILMQKHGLTSNQLCFAFGTKDQDRLSMLDQEEIGNLEQFRQTVKENSKVDEDLLRRTALAVAKAM